MTTPLTGWWLDARIPVHVAPCGGTVTRAVSNCPIRLGPMPSPSDGHAGPNSRVQLSAMEGPLACVSRDARTEGHMPEFHKPKPPASRSSERDQHSKGRTMKNSRHVSRRVSLATASIATLALLVAVASSAQAATAVDLGAADSFVVLAGTGV